MMNIKDLHRHVNALRENNGLPPINKNTFTKHISEMQIKGLIEVDKGEVVPVKNSGETA